MGLFRELNMTQSNMWLGEITRKLDTTNNALK